MNEKRSPKISIGIVSMVVILTVLCLTIFSVITLSTAINERQLSEKSAIAIKNYYEAEAYCSEIANKIGTIWMENKDVTQLQDFAKKNNVDCQLEKNEIYFSYQCPIDKNQALFVTLSLGDVFKIERWSIEATQEWVADQDLQVWDGESME